MCAICNCPGKANKCNLYYSMKTTCFLIFYSMCRFLTVAVNSSKKSPEVIQLLDMHSHFSSATPGIRVCWNIPTVIQVN